MCIIACVLVCTVLSGLPMVYYTEGENNAIFSPYELIYEITALYTAECDKEGYSPSLLPLLTQHS